MVDVQHLQKVHVAYRAALDGGLIPCGGSCERSLPILQMYRCYHCGLYFCPACAPAHFGQRKSSFKINRRDLAEEVFHG